MQHYEPLCTSVRLFEAINIRTLEAAGHQSALPHEPFSHTHTHTYIYIYIPKNCNLQLIDCLSFFLLNQCYYGEKTASIHRYIKYMDGIRQIQALFTHFCVKCLNFLPTSIIQSGLNNPAGCRHKCSEGR